MPSAVVRIYEKAPGLVDALLANRDTVRELLTGVDGFRQWGLVRTETGAVSLTFCDTADGCAETVRLAASWIRDNVADQNIAPPVVHEGTVMVTFTAGKPEATPYVRVAIFGEPGPAGAGERGDEIREVVSAVPGYRTFAAIQTASGAVNIIVADDKASGDEIVKRLRAWISTNYPNFSRPDPQVIEGQGVARIVAAAVPV
jgi:hypothetical protein